MGMKCATSFNFKAHVFLILHGIKALIPTPELVLVSKSDTKCKENMDTFRSTSFSYLPSFHDPEPSTIGTILEETSMSIK